MTTPRFEVRPLGTWDRPTTEERAGSARFRASWDSTVKLLLTEVGLLDGGLVVVQVDANPNDIRRDGMLRARAGVGFPGVKVSFDSRHGPLTYATDAYDSWQANVRAIALGLSALRAVDRYGVTRSGEQYRGWTAVEAEPAKVAMTVDQAATLLAEEGNTTFGAVRYDPAARASAFRTAMKKHHADRGGDSALMRLLIQARDLLDGTR